MYEITVFVTACTRLAQAQKRSNPITKCGGGHGTPSLVEGLLEF